MTSFAILGRLAFIWAVACGGVVPAAAQGYPSRPVTLVVPYPVGGPSDFVARQLEPIASATLGQAMIVDNVGGASGAIGVQRVLNAPADGHTILMATPMDLVLPPLSYTSVKYKPEDLKLVARVGATSMALLVRKDLPYRSVDELVEGAKRAGTEELKYGSTGPGSYYHVVAERFSRLAGIRMLHVPYKGAGPLLIDLMGGQIDLAFVPLAGNVQGLVQEGKVRALGVTSTAEHPSFPSIPPMAVGALKEMDFQIWAAIAVPRDVPADATLKIHEAFYAASGNAQVRRNLEESGSLVPQRQSIQELERFYREEIVRFRSLAKTIQLEPH